MENPEFVARLLRLMAQHDTEGHLFWNSDLEFFVNVNDVFYWGAADLERVTPENIGALERAINDCVAASEFTEGYGCELFAARNRGIRPQGASYPEVKELWPLFDAVGPEREVTFGNPYRPGEYKTQS